MNKRVLFFGMCFVLGLVLSMSCKSTSNFSSSKIAEKSSAESSEDTSKDDSFVSTKIHLSQIVSDECSPIGPMNINGTSLYLYKCPDKDGIIYAKGSWDEEISGDDITDICQIVNAKRATIAYLGYEDSSDYIKIPMEVLRCFSGSESKAVLKDATKLNPSDI